MKKIKIILFMPVFLALFAGMALAGSPGIPHLFWGDVTYNGSLVPEGLTVTAKIDGLEVVSSMTTSEGTYSLIVTDDNNNRVGDVVNMFVENIDTGESGIFCNGCTEPKIDLTLEQDIISPIIMINYPEYGASLTVGTKETLINISTDEDAVCRYGTEPDFDYETATYVTNTGNLEHTFIYTGLSDGQIYNLYYKCKDTNDNINTNPTHHVFSVTDVIPPVITIISPENGTSLSVGTKETLINISTDEDAVCRYGTEPDFDYETAAYFANTDALEHTFTQTNLSDGQIYNLYYKCKDANDNVNANPLHHSFSVSTKQLYCGDHSCNNGETCSTCSTDCGACASSGGGGGGGGYVSPATTTSGGDEENETTTTTTPTIVDTDTPEEEVCVERWVCSDWDACDAGIQERACTDDNDCGTDDRKPFETQPCSPEEVQGLGDSPTGFAFLGALGNPSSLALIGVMLAVLIGVGFMKGFIKI